MGKYGNTKDNSRKTGWAKARKDKRREEAIERNNAYQKLSMKEKLSRNSKKVAEKLKQVG